MDDPVLCGGLNVAQPRDYAVDVGIDVNGGINFDAGNKLAQDHNRGNWRGRSGER
jgi:hypothetical protein